MRPGRELLDGFPRLGWVQEPTPVSAAPAVASELGLRWLGIKRDDLGPDLHGGSKVRKLDFALAAPALADATAWTSVGAIGSGHLATLTAAATELDRRVLASMFWEPWGPWVEDNLAYVASGPTSLRYFSTRLELALRHPSALGHGPGVLAPGASSTPGILGMVRAGLELAEQVRDGALPEVDRIYLPLGTGGVAVGLSIGLALGGVRPRLCAVSAVEWPFSRAGRLHALRTRALAALVEHGVEVPDDFEPAPIAIDRRRLGRGYGHPTAASRAARGALADLGVRLEPVYGGKAMAGLRADAAADARGQRVLFWQTAHRGPLPREEGWEQRLPRALRRRLELARAGKVGRRRALVLGGAAAVALGARLGLHGAVAGWEGHVLYEWQGAVIGAAAEALVPDQPGGPIPGGVTGDEVAVHVDRYLVGAPRRMQNEVQGLFALIEQGTALGRNLFRFTRLSPTARRDFVVALARGPGVLAQAAKGLRDFVYLGYYQDARAWPSLDYGGPRVVVGAHPASRYDRLVAPSGARPPGCVS